VADKDQNDQTQKEETEQKTAAAPPTDDDAHTENEQPVSEGKMRIKVYSPYQTYFNEEAQSITAKNETGPFDILAGHHRFMTLLIPCELGIVTDNGNEKIKISRGIMYVKEDRVTVFLDV